MEGHVWARGWESSHVVGEAGEMSRSGYDESDCDYAMMNLYRANVDRAFAGRRGQAFLKEMLAAMDALPEKKLIPNLMQEETGEVCAIGSVGKARGLDMERLNALAEDEDPDLGRFVGKKFGIAECMARDIMYMNDEAVWKTESPEERFVRMRKWVEEQIKKEPEASK
jgi:hypothetical protein